MVNPAATTTSARTREVLASALEADLKLEVAHTRHRGHAAELAAEARADGLDLVVVLGGDGTVNEVVNGLLAGGDPADVPDVPDLAVVPGGGTNVFSRALGLPRDPVEATGAVLDALREHRRRSIGLGLAGDRWFTFNAGMGWDAEVVARVDRRRRARPTEQRHTTPATTSGPLSSQYFLHTDRRHPALTLHAPGAELERLHMAIVANTAPWTYLGDRPLLDLARGVLRHRAGPLRPDPAADRRHPGRGPPAAARPADPGPARAADPGAPRARPGRAHPAGQPTRSRPGRRRGAGRAARR